MDEGNLEELGAIQVTEKLSEEPVATQVTENRTFNFAINDTDFKQLVDNAFLKVSTGEILFQKFPHTLSTVQREKIHERAKAEGLLTKSTGTRFRVIHLYKDVSISEEIGTQSQSNRGNVSKQLQEATNTELPRSQEVEAVITQEVTDSQSVKVNCPVCEQLCVLGQGLRAHLSRKHTVLSGQL